MHIWEALYIFSAFRFFSRGTMNCCHVAMPIPHLLGILRQKHGLSFDRNSVFTYLVTELAPGHFSAR